MAYTLYTIGHGNMSAEAFLELLRRYQITTVVDVRRQPDDAPFDKHSLERWLPAQGITYRYAGAYLGEPPDGDSLAALRTPDFVMGIARLLNLVVLEKGTYVAVLSREADPYQSHRHHLIARALLDPQVSVIEGVLRLGIIHLGTDGESLPPVTATDFAG
jgi:uncharacterized protein (DUF488 family)